MRAESKSLQSKGENKVDKDQETAKALNQEEPRKKSERNPFPYGTDSGSDSEGITCFDSSSSLLLSCASQADNAAPICDNIPPYEFTALVGVPSPSSSLLDEF